MSTDSLSERAGVAERQPSPQHPKAVLYLEAYLPLVEDWFKELRGSLALAELRASAPTRDLVDNLERLDSFFRDLVDDLFSSPTGTLRAAVAAVGRHRDAVVWEDQLVPGADADATELAASLRHKFKRNISLALLEALVCLESALAYGRDTVGLSGPALEEALRRSTTLLASLSVLHDEQEMVRMRHLTGSPTEIQHPAVSIGDVVAGVFRIQADKFRLVGPAGQEKIRFGPVPPNRQVPSSPTMKCPAHRLVNSDGEPLNNDFWGLLVDIYKLSGRLA